jgi:hypothetical protein
VTCDYARAATVLLHGRWDGSRVGVPLPPPPRRRFQALATLYALVGGAIAIALLFARLGFGAPAIGLAATGALVVVTAVRSRASGVLGILIAYSFAWALLTWPVMLFIAGALWGTWQ